MCISGNIGCRINLNTVSHLSPEKSLFSESHSRYILVVKKKNLNSVKELLSKNKCYFSQIGIFSGDQIIFEFKKQTILKLRVDKAENLYLNSLEKIIHNG